MLKNENMTFQDNYERLQDENSELKLKLEKTHSIDYTRNKTKKLNNEIIDLRKNN